MWVPYCGFHKALAPIFPQLPTCWPSIKIIHLMHTSQQLSMPSNTYTPPKNWESHSINTSHQPLRYLFNSLWFRITYHPSLILIGVHKTNQSHDPTHQHNIFNPSSKDQYQVSSCFFRDQFTGRHVVRQLLPAVQQNMKFMQMMNV